MGNLLNIEVHAANFHDAVSNSDIFENALVEYPTLKGCCTDVDDRKTFENTVLSLYKTVKVSEMIQPTGWAALPQFWVVDKP